MLRRILALLLCLLMLLPAVLAENAPAVQECIYTPGEKTVIRYTLPMMATISLAVYDGEKEVASILNNRKMIAGNHALELDEQFFDGSVSGVLTLVLTVDGAQYTAPFTTEGAAAVPNETPVPAPVAAPTEAPAAEPVIVPTEAPAAAVPSAVITPAYESEYHPGHENCYW
ncbi:MAG: hypothetical protein IJA59_09130, partial [Clostridia bacterium]|nr:hypothetical protein [Clostridia bacterium]